MVDYENGKIYKIVSDNSDLVYIGSTAKYELKDRLAGHVGDFNGGKYCSSSELIKQPHYAIIEVEAYPCNSKTALTTQERFWILKYRDEGINVVNVNIPSGIEADSFADWTKQYNKQYRQDNEDKIKEASKKYRQDNKEKIDDYNKQYRDGNKEKKAARNKQNYQDNKEKILEKKKEYREDNKEKIKEKAATKVTCECGCEVTNGRLSRHTKTKRHIKLMSALSEKAY